MGGVNIRVKAVILWCMVLWLVPLKGELEVELTFAPFDGMPFVSEFEMTTEIERDGEVVSRYRTRNVRDWRYDRMDDGWQLTSKPRQMELDGSRDPIEATIQSALLERPLRYQLDPLGNVVAVEGFEGLDEELLGSLPAGVGPQVIAVINEESQAWRALLQHQSTFGDLSGRVVSSGSQWQQEESIQSPFGLPLKTTRQTEVGVIQRSGDLILVVLRYSNVSDPDAFREVLEPFGEGEDIAALAGEIGLREVGERIFDGATLNLISERIIKIITLPIQLADGQVITERRIERQSRTFSYPTLDPFAIPESITEPTRPPPSPSRAR